MNDLFHNDRVTIKRPDGSIVADNVPADVQSKMIFINDQKLPIEPGYLITRRLPSGVTEEFIVDDPGFHQSFGPIEAHYQIKTTRRAAMRRATQNVYNVSGTNARINIGSYDASHNIVYHAGAPDELFAALIEAIKSSIPSGEQPALLERVNEMQSSAGEPSFVERYKAFIDLAAAHVTVIAPFIPALTALLPRIG